MLDLRTLTDEQLADYALSAQQAAFDVAGDDWDGQYPEAETVQAELDRRNVELTDDGVIIYLDDDGDCAVTL